MSSKGSSGAVRKRPRTRYITIVTPHVLRFRRPILRRPIDEPGASRASSAGSRSPSPPPPPCSFPGKSARIGPLRCLPAVHYTPSVSAASPLSSITTVNVNISPSTASEGEGTGAAPRSTAAQTSWDAAPPSAGRTERLDGSAMDTTRLSMGCDLQLEVVLTDLQSQPESGSLSPDGGTGLPAESAEPTPTIHTQALGGVKMATEGSAAPASAVIQAPATPLLGSHILSASEIPLQNEYIIDGFTDESSQQTIDHQPVDDDDQLSDFTPDGETMARKLFGCAGPGDGGGGDSPWNQAAARQAEHCKGDCGAGLSPGWPRMLRSPPMVKLGPVLLSDGSRGGSQTVTPGCRCSLAVSYNKRMLLDDQLNVQILPADPLSPPEDHEVPDSKASVAIQQLVSSVVPPIGAELVHPRLYLDSESLDGWPSPRAAAAAVMAASLQRPPTPGDGLCPLRRMPGGEALFLPAVGPAAETPDSRLLPHGPAVVLTPDDVVHIEESGASAPRGGAGRAQNPRARGGTRRSAKTTAADGRRACRGRGRGRCGRGRGRGPLRRVSALREAAGELFYTANGQSEEVGCPSPDGGQDRGGDGTDDEPGAAHCRRPYHHFRQVVVGLSDLGPQPLAPTSKYQLWRRLTGTSEMYDLCRCLDLSYMALEMANGEVRYSCNICRKQFSLQSSVRRHHRMVHDDERRYMCAECDASYFQLSDLKRHLLASHTDLKPFACDLCGEQFARDTDYRKHLSLHQC